MGKPIHYPKLLDDHSPQPQNGTTVGPPKVRSRFSCPFLSKTNPWHVGLRRAGNPACIAALPAPKRREATQTIDPATGRPMLMARTYHHRCARDRPTDLSF